MSSLDEPRKILSWPVLAFASREMLLRDVGSVRRYWAQLVFSGRGVPPPELATDGDVVNYVAAHSGAIGYVAPGAALEGVKVVEVE